MHLLPYMYMAVYVSHDCFLFILITPNSPEVVSFCGSCVLQNETGVIYLVWFWHCTHLIFNFERCCGVLWYRRCISAAVAVVICMLQGSTA